MGIHLRSFCVPLLCITFKRQRHKENFTILTPWTKFNEQSSERAFPSLEEYETIFFQSEALSDLSHNIKCKRVERSRTIFIKNKET